MVDHSPDDSGERASMSDRQFDSPACRGDRSSIDDALSLLGHTRRRDVLYHLRDHDVADIETLAAEIAAGEVGLPAERVAADAREAVLIDLHHNHLPKLAEHDLVEYDRRSGAIRRSSPSEVVTEVLECCRSFETE